MANANRNMIDLKPDTLAGLREVQEQSVAPVSLAHVGNEAIRLGLPGLRKKFGTKTAAPVRSSKTTTTK